MTLLEIFEKVNLVVPIEQRRFFNYFADTVNEIQALYDDFVFEEDKVYIPPAVLSDEIAVLPLYHNAIADNILFLAGQGEAYKSEFIRKSRDAYFRYWNDNSRYKRIKRMRW